MGPNQYSSNLAVFPWPNHAFSGVRKLHIISNDNNCRVCFPAFFLAVIVCISHRLSAIPVYFYFLFIFRSCDPPLRLGSCLAGIAQPPPPASTGEADVVYKIWPCSPAISSLSQKFTGLVGTWDEINEDNFQITMIIQICAHEKHYYSSIRLQQNTG